MQIISGTTTFQLNKPSAVAIGKFDGIHKGHMALLQEILRQKRQGLQAVVFTFDPLPDIFFGGRPCKLLSTDQEKHRLLEELGVDVLVEYPLTKESASVSPEKFVTEILVKQMKMAYIAAGYDLSFGDKGKGNAALLKKMAPACGYEVSVIDKICLGEREVSSTYVREAVAEGNMELATSLLGREYLILSTVRHGQRLGHVIGMPTMNLIPEEEKLLPPYGVYFSESLVNGAWYKGVTNIGMRPTVSSEPKVTVETFLFDFDADIYDETVGVKLHHYSRAEMRFENVEALSARMHEDAREAADYFTCHS
ncbi:MAG: bifunctional riboflavin kinase/FAD synthetase [Lachnospiraceae bacterium]|nr:bifunctional riboflavin kinase/FAD synthetase [Lachnospiraceae bacterium]